MKLITTRSSSIAIALLCASGLTAANTSDKVNINNVAECHNNMIEVTDNESVSRCLDEAINQVDRELQIWVNLHQFNLEEKSQINGRYSALKMFKRSQSSFITYRENTCRWQYLNISPDLGADVAYKSCYVTLSKTRVSLLTNIKTEVAAPQ
jgi:uncharacterized protein YecT (DUF1311 family)